MFGYGTKVKVRDAVLKKQKNGRRLTVFFGVISHYLLTVSCFDSGTWIRVSEAHRLTIPLRSVTFMFNDECQKSVS